MFDNKARYRMPKTVDEAAELLISDLLIQHLQALSEMTEAEFDALCDQVTPYLVEEFRLWQGNEALLRSCFERCDDEEQDPARVILAKVKKILKDFHGFLVIT